MTAAAADAALLDAVLTWRDRPAKADLRGLPVVNVPVLGQLRKAIPEGLAQRTLAAAYASSVRLSQPRSLLKTAVADSIEALRARPHAECAALARKVSRQSGWLAGGSGAALGIAGAAGLVADAPALLLIALRTLVRLGYCHGEHPSPALTAALFALASADTDDEKELAWRAALTAAAGGQVQAREGDVEVRDAALRDGLERAAEREFAKQALTGSLQKLATTMVQRLGMKKAAGMLPFVGAVVGGAVNIRFVYLLSEAAQMAFSARRLIADGLPLKKLLARAPLPAVRANPSAPKKKKRLSRTPPKPAKLKPVRRRPNPAP